MEKQTLNHHRVVISDKRKQTDTLEPKGTESGSFGFCNKTANGHWVPGLKMAPTALTIILHMELGKPHELPKSGKNLAKGTDCSGGRGDSKKQMPACNRQDRID